MYYLGNYVTFRVRLMSAHTYKHKRVLSACRATRYVHSLQRELETLKNTHLKTFRTLQPRLAERTQQCSVPTSILSNTLAVLHRYNDCSHTTHKPGPWALKHRGIPVHN